MNGIVKFYNAQRGWGMIQPLIGLGPDTPLVFFHISAVRSSEKAGQRRAIPAGAEVKFVLVRGDRGPQAADVQLIELTGAALRVEPKRSE